MSSMAERRAANRDRKAKIAAAEEGGSVAEVRHLKSKTIDEDEPKPVRRQKRVNPGGAFVGSVKKESIAVFAKRNMGIYATEVNMARSVPDLIDGLKPVQRRILWEAFLQRGQFNKTARIVGGVIGRWHPHGDASIESAVTTLVQHPTPTMLGTGNWGGLLDSAAAMRYTNCRLSNYGETFFDPDYINKEVTSFVINYDDTEYEPVSVPSMLPNILLNGGEGIGVGVTTGIPTFTPESVIAILTRILQGEELTAVDYAKTMKFQSRWGGHVLNTKENRQAWLQLFKTGSSSIQFQAHLDIDRDNKAIEIDDWPPGLTPTALVEKIRPKILKNGRTRPGLAEVDQVFNNKGDTGFRIEMRKDHNYTQFDALVEKIKRMTTSRKSFKINVTYRKSEEAANGETVINTRFLSVSIPKLLQLWLRERLGTEKRSLEYRMRKQQAAIDYSKLLIFAASKLDIIFKGLRTSDPQKYLVQHLKITGEQADMILDLKVRQLSKLDSDRLKTKLKEQQDFMVQLKTWYKKPRGKVIADLGIAMAAIEKDRKFESAKSNKVSIG